MIGLGFAVAAASLTGGLAVALLLRKAATVRLQLAGLAALSVVVPLVAVLFSGWVMFHMGDDVKILAVAAGSATAAVGAGLFLARSIADSIERVRASAVALASGDLGARAPESGPAEVAQLGGSFNAMAESLETLFDARRELIAWASHDLRTPLASMQAMLEAIEDGIVEPDRLLPALREQVRTLSALTNDLFELARIDAELLQLELRACAVDPIVRSCLRALEPEARARKITLEAQLADAATARCAPEKVERVLYNLLTNALRHTPSDGSVGVRVEPVAGEVLVTVEDTGEGLTPEIAAKMFDRFWRGDRARSSGGAGLGLAIARGLIEAHGGRIWAEARPGRGAKVCFTLPAVN